VASQRQSNKQHVISTWDVFGNAVHMTQKTWDVKRDRHPEILPLFPDEIEKTVQEPEFYRHSTAEYAKADTICFERTVSNTADTLRVIVQYEDTTFLQGKTTGKITTVYPPNSSATKTLGPRIEIKK
jgi:hypothetical protein